MTKLHEETSTFRTGAMPFQQGRSSTGNGKSIPATNNRQSDSFVCSTILPPPEPGKGPAWPSLIANCPQEWFTPKRAGQIIQVTNSDHFEVKMPRKYGGVLPKRKLAAYAQNARSRMEQNKIATRKIQ
ncbi:hypothetical protein [Ruegeria sp. HKCCE3926]|uniref:hypothetical protein n=1 Tax=Ruegeria sp. HKCCE3926 TaxID=2794831 RepID=UPI001AE54C13|nr:hypothetical protein [Ruegeria sp. HKCCE3926]